MADAPPPPPPPTGPADAQPLGPGVRPPQVTAAGVIEIVLGILVLLVTVLIFNAASQEDVLGDSLVIVVLLLQTLQGVLDLVAGILVLKLSRPGRILAIVMAAIGAAFAALSLAQGVGGAQMLLVLLGITLRVLVIVFLNQLPARRAFGI